MYTRTVVWDVFISHASEDKDSVARPLAKLLRERDVRVWLDDHTITLGDVLREKIDAGLASSRFGIVVLSQAFLAKKWTQIELNALVEREVLYGKVILPIWHGIDHEFLVQRSPILAARAAASTSDGLPAVVDSVLKALGKADSIVYRPVSRAARLTAAEWVVVQRRCAESEINIARLRSTYVSAHILEVRGTGMPRESVAPGCKIRFTISPGSHDLWLAYEYKSGYLGASAMAMAAQAASHKIIESNRTGKMDFHAGRYFFECTDCPPPDPNWWQKMWGFSGDPSFFLKLVNFEPWPELVRAGMVQPSLLGL